MGIPTKAPRRSFLQAAGGVLLLKPEEQDAARTAVCAAMKYFQVEH